MFVFIILIKFQTRFLLHSDFPVLFLFPSYPRQYAVARINATAIPSVCLSVTRVICIETAERIIKILSLSDRPII